ncbi:PREDICTED: putative F-box protein At3g21120 [Camelina sativa]|uniref:F-box protein At3g21120 n=1 Tax=Camelina sativa TaxID=90675 RepID=A0ABM0XMG0_CAMSA|nr:PREDICTED: putative F-box protein At3g21120 [Camelina sativa]
MKKMRSTVYLPEDLLVEILSRVPTVALARLRSTCKRWNALFKDGRFAKKHFANAPRHSSSLVLGLIDSRVYLVSINLHGIKNNNVDPSAKLKGPFSLKDPLSTSKEVYIRYAFHCDGLLLCITEDYRLFVWNPCLGEMKWIQPRNLYKEFDYYAFGYGDKSSCYKILRMQQFANDRWHTMSEVYDLASNKWGSVSVTTDWVIQLSKSCGMYVKGTTYWLALGKDRPPHDRYFLLSFDFSSERFQSLSLPADANHSSLYVALSMTKEEQQFRMFASFDSDERNKSDVWIATKVESTGAMSWTKFRRFHSHIRLTVSAHKKNVFVCKPKHEAYNNIFYIVGDDLYILKVYKYTGDMIYPILLTYVPSLVQIQQGI